MGNECFAFRIEWQPFAPLGGFPIRGALLLPTDVPMTENAIRSVLANVKHTGRPLVVVSPSLHESALDMVRAGEFVAVRAEPLPDQSLRDLLEDLAIVTGAKAFTRDVGFGLALPPSHQEETSPGGVILLCISWADVRVEDLGTIASLDIQDDAIAFIVESGSKGVRQLQTMATRLRCAHTLSELDGMRTRRRRLGLDPEEVRLSTTLPCQDEPGPIRLLGEWVSPCFVTEPETMETVLLRPRILLCNFVLDDPNFIVGALEYAVKEFFPLVIVAPAFADAPVALMVVNKLRGVLECLPIRLGDTPSEANRSLQDLASATGARILNAEDQGRSFNAWAQALGTAEKVVAGRSSSVIIKRRLSEDFEVTHERTTTKPSSDAGETVRRQGERYKEALRCLDECGEFTLENFIRVNKIAGSPFPGNILTIMWENAQKTIAINVDGKWLSGTERLRLIIRQKFEKAISAFDRIGNECDSPRPSGKKWWHLFNWLFKRGHAPRSAGVYKSVGGAPVSLDGSHIIKEGKSAWNKWRQRNPAVVPTLKEVSSLSDSRLSGFNLRSVDLSGMYINNANLARADLRNSCLRRAKLHRTILRDAALNEADLSEAYLVEADLSGADLSKCNLSRSDLHHANLSHAKLIESDLREAELVGANLRRARLVKADLTKANLNAIGLRQLAEKEQEVFGGSGLARSIHVTDLTDADLRGANLLGADLRGADLTGADLTGANVKDAMFQGATLTRAIGLA